MILPQLYQKQEFLSGLELDAYSSLLITFSVRRLLWVLFSRVLYKWDYGWAETWESSVLSSNQINGYFWNMTKGRFSKDFRLHPEERRLVSSNVYISSRDHIGGHLCRRQANSTTDISLAVLPMGF